MQQINLQSEKEELSNYISRQLTKINESLVQDNNPLIANQKESNQFKEAVLNIVQVLAKTKKQEVEFYNSLLLDIPILNLFEEEINDLDQLKKYLSNILTSTHHSVNVGNLNGLIASVEIFEFINKKTDINKLAEKSNKYGGEVLLMDYIGVIWKQAKQEELLGLIIYINSGKATLDYISYLSMETKPNKETFLYEKFKESFKGFIVKEKPDGTPHIEEYTKSSSKKISTANHLDYGVIVDEKTKTLHLGFATSEYCTKGQQKQYFQKYKLLKESLENNLKYKLFKFKPYYITNGLINENQLEYQKEYQKTFLNSFKKELTLGEKNLINCASIVAIMGNLASTDKLRNLDLMDFLSVSPYVSGANTYNIKQIFEELRKNNNPREVRLFLIDYATQLLKILEKMKPHDAMHEAHTKVLMNCENIFKASLDGFYLTFKNGSGLLDKSYIKKVVNFNKLYESIHLEKFQASMPNTSELSANKIYDVYSSIEKVQEYLQKNEDRLQKLLLTQASYKPIEMEISNPTKERIKALAQILKQLPPLAVDNNRMLTVIEEMHSLRKFFPNREIKTLMRSKQASLSTHNFMKIYKKWEAQEPPNIKYYISNIIFNNIDDIMAMQTALEKAITQLPPIQMQPSKQPKNKI